MSYLSENDKAVLSRKMNEAAEYLKQASVEVHNDATAPLVWRESFADASAAFSLVRLIIGFKD